MVYGAGAILTIRNEITITLMYLNIKTPKNIYFPFGIYGKLMVLGVPIHEHFRVTIILGYSNLANSEITFPPWNLNKSTCIACAAN